MAKNRVFRLLQRNKSPFGVYNPKRKGAVNKGEHVGVHNVYSAQDEAGKNRLLFSVANPTFTAIDPTTGRFTGQGFYATFDPEKFTRQNALLDRIKDIYSSYKLPDDMRQLADFAKMADRVRDEGITADSLTSDITSLIDKLKSDEISSAEERGSLQKELADKQALLKHLNTAKGTLLDWKNKYAAEGFPYTAEDLDSAATQQAAIPLLQKAMMSDWEGKLREQFPYYDEAMKSPETIEESLGKWTDEDFDNPTNFDTLANLAAIASMKGVNVPRLTEWVRDIKENPDNNKLVPIDPEQDPNPYQYEIFRDTFQLPPLLGTDGKQLVDENGTPLWDWDPDLSKATPVNDKKLMERKILKDIKDPEDFARFISSALYPTSTGDVVPLSYLTSTVYDPKDTVQNIYENGRNVNDALNYAKLIDLANTTDYNKNKQQISDLLDVYNASNPSDVYRTLLSQLLEARQKGGKMDENLRSIEQPVLNILRNRASSPIAQGEEKWNTNNLENKALEIFGKDNPNRALLNAWSAADGTPMPHVDPYEENYSMDMLRGAPLNPNQYPAFSKIIQKLAHSNYAAKNPMQDINQVYGKTQKELERAERQKAKIIREAMKEEGYTDEEIDSDEIGKKFEYPEAARKKETTLADYREKLAELMKLQQSDLPTSELAKSKYVYRFNTPASLTIAPPASVYDTVKEAINSFGGGTNTDASENVKKFNRQMREGGDIQRNIKNFVLDAAKGSRTGVDLPKEFEDWSLMQTQAAEANKAEHADDKEEQVASLRLTPSERIMLKTWNMSDEDIDSLEQWKGEHPDANIADLVRERKQQLGDDTTTANKAAPNKQKFSGIGGSAELRKEEEQAKRAVKNAKEQIQQAQSAKQKFILHHYSDEEKAARDRAKRGVDTVEEITEGKPKKVTVKVRRGVSDAVTNAIADRARGY